jgi:hypothetical protein
MNPEDEIRELREALMRILQGVQDTIASGEVLSDEFQGVLAQAINATTQRMDQLQSEIGQRPPVEPPARGPEPVGVDLLWQLSAGDETAFVGYLRTFPDPALNALLRNPTQLRQTIADLQQRMPPGQQPTSPEGIPHADINSSNIYGFRYNPKNGQLMVRFQNGGVYGYSGVPAGVFNTFRQGAVPAATNGQNEHGRWWTGKQPSLGAAFYNLIRQGGYAYQRLQ